MDTVFDSIDRVDTSEATVRNIALDSWTLGYKAKNKVNCDLCNIDESVSELEKCEERLLFIRQITEMLLRVNKTHLRLDVMRNLILDIYKKCLK